jgi:hypothetical protein
VFRRIGKEIRQEGGQVLVLVVLCMGVLLMFGALAINLGSWFATDNDLQQKADSAALAGAQYVASSKQVPAGSTCAALVSPNNTGAGCASAYLAADNVTPAAGYPTQSVDATTGGIAITVKVQGTPQNPFQGLMNVNSTRVASATVEAIPVSSVANPLPIGVSIAAAATWQAGSPVTMTFTQNTINSTSAQQFTILDLCGQGIGQIAGCVGGTANCGCTLNVGDNIDQDSGNKWCQNSGQVSGAWNTQVGKKVFIVVYDANGNVAGFTQILVAATTCSPQQTITGTFTGNVTNTASSNPNPNPGAVGQYGLNSIVVTQ